MKRSEEHTDAHLIGMYLSGNALGLNELVKRWHLRFCRKANQLLKDPEQAKDIAQESWQIIMIKLKDLNDHEKFGGWAMRIVYSRSLDALRGAAKDRVKKDKYAKDVHTEIDEAKDDREILKQELLVAIKKLPELQQQVIRLFYVEEYTLKEIAKLLGISIGTAKSRLFHAREKLKQHLKHIDYEK